MLRVLYIHKLADLNERAAEIESVYLVRDLKQKMSYPLIAQQVWNYMQDHLVSESDIFAMTQAQNSIEPTILKIKQIAERKDPDHEPINLGRTMQILSNVTPQLANNMQYAQSIFVWRKEFIEDATTILNMLPYLETQEQKVAVNNVVKKMFQKLLRSNEFCSQYLEIINESHTGSMQGLMESMQKGYFFHVTLEEELRKESFDNIRHRIPNEKLLEVEEIKKDILLIKKGVDSAYDANMKLVNCALILFSCIRWVRSGR